MQRLKHFGYPVLTLELTNQIRAYFNAKDASDLFYRFGKAYIPIEQLKHWKSDKESHERKQAEKAIQSPIVDNKTFRKEMQHFNKDRKESDILLIGEDMDKVDYTLAKCCNPIPGDSIFGFITISEGIKIHRNNCSNAEHLMSKMAYRCIKARWKTSDLRENLATITVHGIDRMGIVNKLTEIISNEHNVNMKSISFETDDGIFEGNLNVLVYDTEHLEQLIRKFEQVEGVQRVYRKGL